MIIILFFCMITGMAAAAEQAAFLVDLFLPDLQAEQRLLAVRRQWAGERHGKADLDRLARLRVRRTGQRHRRNRRAGQQGQELQASKHRAFLPRRVIIAGS
jgi:hypothetical protein